jgi:sugar porter (SP) family MFS transporter
MNATEVGLVTSMFTLGGFLGALCAGPISARQGRIRTMLITTIFFAIGPVFEALAPSISVMAFGRLLSGLGAGASIVVVPLYVSEISPPAERGFFGSFTQVMTNGGIFTTQLLGFFFSYGQMWRVVLATAGVIGAANAVGLLFAVESPKWLAANGQTRKARENFQRIRGDKFDIEEEFTSWGHEDEDEGEAQSLLRDTESALPTPTITSSKREAAGMIEVIRHSEHRKAVICVIVIMVAQQFTGINSIIMYGVALLADLMKSNSAMLNLAVSALNIAVTIGCAPMTDKLGRKFCLLVSICGMGISSVLLAIGIQQNFSLLSALAVGFFVASFAFGLGPIPFILASELVGPEAVSSTQTWALCCSWVSTFCVAQFFPLVNEALGKGVIYYFFAGLAAFFASFVFYYVPETKGYKNADEVWGRTSERLD